MIEVDKTNVSSYFERQTFEKILDIVADNIRNEINFLPPTGIGCMCLSDIEVKNSHDQNVFIEYGFIITGSKNLDIAPFEIKTKSIIIFDGDMPAIVRERIAATRQLLSDFNRLN